MVPRQRLVDKLSAGLDNKLTLVCAPAGFGKTTMLSQSIVKLAVPFTWLNLDKSDNNEGQFWSYFIAAINQLWPDIDIAQLKSIEVPSRLNGQIIITDIVNQIVEHNTTSEQPSIIVLDDYHVVEALPINEGKEIAHVTTFPYMRVTWNTYPE